jgi:hypothetical protein
VLHIGHLSVKASLTSCHIKNIPNKNTNKSENIDCHWLSESFRIFHLISTFQTHSILIFEESAFATIVAHHISAFGVLTKKDLTKTSTTNISDIYHTNIVGLKMALNILLTSKYLDIHLLHFFKKLKYSTIIGESTINIHKNQILMTLATTRNNRAKV